MGSPIVTLRVVFDTNTVISALLFSKGRLAWLRTVWRQGTVVPLVSKATAEEIVRVLGYPKFHLDAADQDELLGDFLPFAEIIEADLTTGEVPICRDKHDQKFLELAAAGEADALVTGDTDLLALGEQFHIPIMKPADFHRRIGFK